MPCGIVGIFSFNKLWACLRPSPNSKDELELGETEVEAVEMEQDLALSDPYEENCPLGTSIPFNAFMERKTKIEPPTDVRMRSKSHEAGDASETLGSSQASFSETKVEVKKAPRISCAEYLTGRCETRKHQIKKEVCTAETKKEPATSREIKSKKVTLLVKTSSEGTGSRAFKLTVNPQLGVGEVMEIPLRNSFGLLHICHLPIKGKTAHS